MKWTGDLFALELVSIFSASVACTLPQPSRYVTENDAACTLSWSWTFWNSQVYDSSLRPSSLTTFLKFYSFHRFLYEGCSMALGESCVIQNGHRESCHHVNFFFLPQKKKFFTTFFFTAAYWTVYRKTFLYNNAFQSHACSFANRVL